MEISNQYKQRPRAFSLGPTKRVWAKVIEKVSNYQRQNTGLDFAVDLFYNIEKMIENGFELCLNIPLTLTGAHDNFLQTIFTGEQPIGKIYMTPSFSKTKFENHVQKSINESIWIIKNKRLVEKFSGDSEQVINNRSILLPFVTMKQKIFDNQYINSNLILNEYQYKRINSIDSSQLVQSYIFTKTMTATIIRFFYNINPQKSVAYQISNEFQMLEGRGKFKDKWRVEEKRENSCIILKIMHENKSFYTQTINLVEALRKFFDKDVSYLTLDWILEASGKYYLIDIKSARLIDPKPKYRISKSLSELLSTVTCCMCLQSCNQSEISKILTAKLIINFYEHLKRRGVNLSFRINFKKLSNFSRVCNLCYNLVVAETKLIELEKTMSHICNIHGENGQTSMIPVEVRTDNYETQLMNQWRLFFYIEDIKNFNSIFEKDVKDQIDTGGKIFLNLQINDSVMSFELKPPYTNNLVTKIIKVQYIFSQDQSILSFLHEAEVRVQITLKNKSHKLVADGCIHGIYDEGETQNQEVFLQRKYKQILLFNEYSHYSILGLYIGISNDGPKNVTSFKFNNSHSIFKPHIYILDCQSLPTEWMEIIDPNGSSGMDKSKIGSEVDIQENETKRRKPVSPKMRFRTSSIKMNFHPFPNEKRPKLVL